MGVVELKSYMGKKSRGSFPRLLESMQWGKMIWVNLIACVLELGSKVEKLWKLYVQTSECG